MKKLKALKPGDVVALVSPSSHFKHSDFLKGVAKLSAQGWICQYRSDIFAKELYMSGSDERRAQELTQALCDPLVKAIFFTRGGYGAMRILQALDRIKKTPSPKIVAGFSDATAILYYVQKRWGWHTFYAPSVNSFAGKAMTKSSSNRFFKELSGKNKYPQKVVSLKVLKPGKAQGELVGGCLSLVSRLLGTSYDQSFSGKILFLEDVGEDPYAIDRMLTHLRLAKKFKNLKGLIWGGISENKPQKEYIQMLKSVFAQDHFPIFYGFPAGHQKDRYTFAFGGRVKMNSTKKSVEFLDSPFLP